MIDARCMVSDGSADMHFIFDWNSANICEPVEKHVSSARTTQQSTLRKKNDAMDYCLRQASKLLTNHFAVSCMAAPVDVNLKSGCISRNLAFEHVFRN